MSELTDRQREALQFIQKYHIENGYPPTLQEIAEGLGINSTFAVRDHLAALERKGAIKRKPGTARAITVLNWQ